PYGRRTTTFPVWSHKHGKTFPAVLFQNDINQDVDYCLDTSISDYASCGENDLSHPYDQSSHEDHYCRPRTDADRRHQHARTVARTDDVSARRLRDVGRDRAGERLQLDLQPGLVPAAVR